MSKNSHRSLNRPTNARRCIDRLLTILQGNDASESAWAAATLGPLALGGPFVVEEDALAAIEESLKTSRSAACRSNCATALAAIEWRTDGHDALAANFRHASQAVETLSEALKSESDDLVRMTIIDAITVQAYSNFAVAENVLTAAAQDSAGRLAEHASLKLAELREQLD